MTGTLEAEGGKKSEIKIKAATAVKVRQTQV